MDLTIETRIAKLENDINELKKIRCRVASVHSEIEEEIQEDVHCLLRFVRRIMCIVCP